MSALKDHYSEAIEAAISKAKTCRDLVTVEAFDGTEAYAYPHREGRIAWGINTEKEGIIPNPVNHFSRLGVGHQWNSVLARIISRWLVRATQRSPAIFSRSWMVSK